jgi:hypothetical protein
MASCSSRDWRRSSCEILIWTSSPLSLETSSSRCFRAACAPSSAVCSCWSRPSASSRVKHSQSSAVPGLGESSLLLLELGLRLLARSPFLTELLLRHGERGGLAR